MTINEERVLPVPRERYRRRVRRADLLETLVWFSVAIVLALFLADGGATRFTSISGAASGIGIVAGLVGTDLLLLQLVLAARLPIVDRTFGHDRAIALHQKLGKPVLYLILAHVALLLVGYGIAEGLNPVAEIFSMLANVPDMPLAFVGTGLLIAVVITSLVIVRRRFRYELWYLVHLLGYGAVLAALGHQFSAGQMFAEGTWARWYWILLYASTALALLVYRFGIPVIRSIRHRLEVTSVEVIAPGVTSIELSGRDLARLPAHAGQFFIWRFWRRGMWWHSHPFSLSSAPNGDRLRVTVRDLGDGTKPLASLPRGTRVSIEGPYGLFTEIARTSNRIVLVGAGIGIAPIRSLLEHARFSAGEATVILRAPSEDHVYLWREIYDLCVSRGARLHVLHGSRPRGVDSWLTSDAWRSGTTFAELAPGLVDSDVYICGPRDWSDSVVRDAKAAGVPSHQLHFERFDW